MIKPIPHTEVDPGIFESINPSQFIKFTIPNTLINRQLIDTPEVRVYVFDSPFANAAEESPVIAAMIVPKDREIDWTYATKSGLTQLLSRFRTVSRIILIGNSPAYVGSNFYKHTPVTDTPEQRALENELKPLLVPLHPKSSSISDNGLPETLFLTDEHDMAYRAILRYLMGRTVGSFLVEDVELAGDTDRGKQFRRRMRFRRMPYLVRSEALLVPIIDDDEGTITAHTDLESLREIEGAKFEVDTSVLVHQHLISMVSGLSLIASDLNLISTPRALCLGVGGGVLLSFLESQIGFEVTGVEVDDWVLHAARKLFGFNKSKSIQLIVGDAVQLIQNFPPQNMEMDTDESNVDAKFDVVFVDFYSSDAEIGFCAPPTEFVQSTVFEGLRSVLDDDHGVVIMNVVPLNEEFYTTLVNELKEVFHKVYGIDVGNQNNFVVMATMSPTSAADNENEFLKKLKSVIPGTYLNSIVEL